MCPRRASEHITESPSAKKAILSSVLSGQQTAAQKVYTARSLDGWDTTGATSAGDSYLLPGLSGPSECRWWTDRAAKKTADKRYWVYLLSITEKQRATLNHRVKTFSRRWQIVCLPLRWENSKGLQPQSPKGKERNSFIQIRHEEQSAGISNNEEEGWVRRGFLGFQVLCNAAVPSGCSTIAPHYVMTEITPGV